MQLMLPLNHPFSAAAGGPSARLCSLLSGVQHARGQARSPCSQCFTSGRVPGQADCLLLEHCTPLHLSQTRGLVKGRHS